MTGSPLDPPKGRPNTAAFFSTKQILKPSEYFLNNLTGSREAVYTLARTAYFADLEADLDAGSVLHSENLFLVDKDRRSRGVYNGSLPFVVERLIEDIETLKKEYAE